MVRCCETEKVEKRIVEEVKEDYGEWIRVDGVGLEGLLGEKKDMLTMIKEVKRAKQENDSVSLAQLQLLCERMDDASVIQSLL